MNTSTRFFNGTRDGAPYQARITETSAWIFEVEVFIFDRETGEPHYSYTRRIEDEKRCDFGPAGLRRLIAAVIKNPDDY